MTNLEWVRVASESISFVFLTLVKSLLAPLLLGLVVSSVVRMKETGLGLRAVVYFEVVTTVALLLGWAAMELGQAGVGIATGGAAVRAEMGLSDALVGAVPSSVVEAMGKNAVLPMLIFFGMVGWAARRMGEKARGLVEFCAGLEEVMFAYARMVMKLAPVGMVAAVVATVLGGGWRAVETLARFVGWALAAQLVMGVVVYGLILVGFGVPVGRFLNAVKEAAGIAMLTTSSAAALPKAIEGMERFGIRREELGVVMPLGLSLNLAGSTIQLMMGVMFAAQAAGVSFSVGQLVMVMLTMKVAAKGVAGIPRANFVILSATLPGFGLPLETLPLLLAVDGVIDMVRTPVNVLGNCVAAAVLGRKA